jgi:hypothetical protein
MMMKIDKNVEMKIDKNVESANDNNVEKVLMVEEPVQ